MPVEPRRLLRPLGIGLLWLLLAISPRADAQLGCSISASGVAFGSYSPFSGSPVDSSGTVQVQCLLALGFEVTLSTGQGSFAVREMKSGGSALQYNLYTSSARSNIWGDGTSGTATRNGSLGIFLSPVTFTIYGRIPAGQNPVVGSYSDTITATVIF